MTPMSNTLVRALRVRGIIKLPLMSLGKSNTTIGSPISRGVGVLARALLAELLLLAREVRCKKEKEINTH